MIETKFAGECVILGVRCWISYEGCEMRITEAPCNRDKDELTCSKAHAMVALLEGISAVGNAAVSLHELTNRLDTVIDALDCATTGLSPVEAINKLKELALGRSNAAQKVYAQPSDVVSTEIEIDATDLDLDVRGNQFVLRMGSAKRMFSAEVSKALAETLLASRKGSEPVQDPEPALVAQKPVTAPSRPNHDPLVKGDWVSGESKEEDESEDEGSDEKEIDVPQEIKDTKKLATVLAWLRDGGLEDVEVIVARCEELKPHVPYIARIKEEDLRGRVERTLAVMDG